MSYAKVVVGLPIDGPFDYLVPSRFYKKIKVGVRVEVSFRSKKMVGYCIKLTQRTNIKNTKPILKIFDDSPLLDKNMLLLTKELSNYYCCSWGEAIETALPESLRRGRRIPGIERVVTARTADNPEALLIHALDSTVRWDIYLKAIKENLDNNRSAIVLFPDFNSVLKARQIINANLGISPGVLYRKQPRELETWREIKEGKTNIVVGMRSGVFAPFNNLGLVIIDEEQDSAYKQDQVPHYHAREVAFMRVNIEKARLILGSASPSLESIYLARKHKISPSLRLRIDDERSRSIKYIFRPRGKDFPEVKIIDMRHSAHLSRKRNEIFSKILADSIYSVLNAKGKILLFLNRKGFATVASCIHCGIILKCPRCNINLNYHFKDNILNCHYCNFKMEPPKICPHCNSGYIKYAGTGTEKMESELARIFTPARIKRLDNQHTMDIKDIDIVVATSSIIKQTDYNFDLTGVIFIDNSLNRIDLRASEKTFALLVGLLGLTIKRLVIQTRLPGHHCFHSLIKKDINLFYDEELRQREQLHFPPYRNLVLVKLRGMNEDRVREASRSLFEKLIRSNKNKNIKILAVNPGYPDKLRGKFYWQILIRTGNVKKTNAFLKMNLKSFLHSGIIITVDVDPI